MVNVKTFLCALTLLFIFSFGHVETALAQPGGNETVLVQGNPPLTQSMVNKSIDLLEWSLGVTFSAEHQSKIQRILINVWRTNNRAQIKSTLDVVEIHNQLSLMGDTERNNMRERFRSSLLQSLNKEPKDELSQATLEAYEAARVPGPKPSTLANNSPTQPVEENPNKQFGTTSAWKSHGSGLWTYTAVSTPPTAEQAKALLNKIAPVASQATADTQPLAGFDEAIGNARKFLNERASREALAAFNSSPQARSANRAAVAAGGALISRRPLAALAALLRAHELDPRNATHLANLAAVLSYVGLPREALAILNSPLVRNGSIASPLGMGGQAAAFNTRGHALLQLGHAKEAEAALRQAVAQSPNLSEAQTNLAVALWLHSDERKKDEAAKMIAAVWRRVLENTGVSERTGDETEPPVPAKETPEQIPIEIFESNRTGTAGLDLSRGKRLHLPDLKIPSTLEDAVAMSPKYRKLTSEVSEVIDRLSKRGEQLQETAEQQAPGKLNRTVNEINAMRALGSLEHVKRHPTIRPLWEKAHKAFINNYQGVNFNGLSYSTSEMYGEPPAGVAKPESLSQQLLKKYELLFNPEEAEIRSSCANSVGQACPARIRANYDVKRCEAAREVHAKWRSAIHDYDTALRNYLEAAYKYMTAGVANIPDPIEHELFRVQIEKHIYEEWLILIEAVDSPFDDSRQGASYCRSRSHAAGEDLKNLQAEKPDYCPDLLKGNKVKVDFEIVSVSFGCETIGVELSSPWLGLFVEGEGTFKGGWISQYQGVTIGFGVKAGVKVPGVPEEVGAGVEGKAGGYVKVDQHGRVTDAGFKTGATASTGIGGSDAFAAGETGADLELTILPALGLHGPVN